MFGDFQEDFVAVRLALALRAAAATAGFAWRAVVRMHRWGTDEQDRRGRAR